jgi:chromosome segregation ATPase
MALSTQDLFEIRKIIVAAKLLDSGAFDADIKRLEDASQAQLQYQLDTVAAEKQTVAKQLQDFQDALDAKQVVIDKQLETIEAKNKQLDDKQAELNKTAADVGAQMDALTIAVKDTQAKVGAMNADAESRINAAQQRENDVSLREQALAQGQADLAAKLQTIKALSAV